LPGSLLHGAQDRRPQPIRIVQGDTDVVIALTSNHDRSIARYLNKSIAYREPAPGLPEAILFESRGHGGLLQHCVSSAWTLPIGSNNRRLLNQSIHSRLANSTASNDRHGRRLRPVEAIDLLGEGTVVGIANAANRRLYASLG
jgi:hypothetical protein